VPATASPLSAAASTLLRPALSGPSRPAVVVGVTPAAVYVRRAAPDAPLVALVSADAVRVPNALVTPARADEAPFAAAAPGSRVVIRLDSPSAPQIGAGEADLGGTRGVKSRCDGIVVHVVRWWTPPRPRIGDLARARARLEELRELVDATASPLPSYLVDPAAGLGRAISARDTGAAVRAVTHLLGLGPGLTPSGDDVVAGALVTLRAIADPDHGLAAIADAVAITGTVAPARTTAVSAALLHHAATGHCIPQLARLITALDRGHELSGPVEALTRVGHRSGGEVARGVLLALDAAAGPDAVGMGRPHAGPVATRGRSRRA